MGNARAYLTHKRERFYLAESKGKPAQGRGNLDRAVKDDNGAWVPAESVEGIFMNECNYKKMGFNPITDMPKFPQKCDKLALPGSWAMLKSGWHC